MKQSKEMRRLWKRGEKGLYAVQSMVGASKKEWSVQSGRAGAWPGCQAGTLGRRPAAPDASRGWGGRGRKKKMKGARGEGSNFFVGLFHRATQTRGAAPTMGAPARYSTLC